MGILLIGWINCPALITFGKDRCHDKASDQPDMLEKTIRGLKARLPL
jgi:hypothetical protein